MNKNKISAVERFQEAIKNSMANYYHSTLSNNVKRAFEQKRKNGGWIGIAPLGYLNVFTNERTRTDIVVDSEREHLIQKMFELFADGNDTIETIRAKASKLGLKGRKGSELSANCVNAILKNPFYCGTAVSKTHGAYQHKYPHLISKELFEKCQDVFTKKLSTAVKVAM